jgi:hypothetical protein
LVDDNKVEPELTMIIQITKAIDFISSYVMNKTDEEWMNDRDNPGRIILFILTNRISIKW